MTTYLATHSAAATGARYRRGHITEREAGRILAAIIRRCRPGVAPIILAGFFAGAGR
jgi:hypothetical protein